MVDAVSNNAVGSGASTKPVSAQDGANQAAQANSAMSGNFDMFLKLLTTQIKNQDPLNPTDSTQFTQQLTQMTGVQQQILTNNLLATLVGQNTSGVQSGIGYIGKTVMAPAGMVTLKNSQINWGYSLPDAASDLSVSVVDSKGATVWTGKLSAKDMGQGDHTFSWNGKDVYGNTRPDGDQYFLKVTAKDPTGNPMPVVPTITGQVTGVKNVNGVAMVQVGQGYVKVSDIVSVVSSN